MLNLLFEILIILSENKFVELILTQVLNVSRFFRDFPSFNTDDFTSQEIRTVGHTTSMAYINTRKPKECCNFID